MALWPPFLFTGIRVVRLDDDFRFARVELRQHWYNRNYVGTHFGGSLFAMTDPFWMVLLMQRLGDGYRVWDQAAEIRFEKPGATSSRASASRSTCDASPGARHRRMPGTWKAPPSPRRGPAVCWAASPSGRAIASCSRKKSSLPTS